MQKIIVKYVSILCLISSLGALSACEDKAVKPDADPVTEAPAQPDAAQTPPAPDAPADPPAANTAPDDAQMAERIEQLAETCAKLEQPVQDACTAFHDRVVAKNADAIADLDAVLEGTRVAQPNMVYLEEETAAMLVKKYGKPE